MLCFRKIPVVKKLIRGGGGGGGEVSRCQDFPSKVFCLTVPKNFVGEPFSVSLFSGVEKLRASEGYVTIFRRIVFVSQCRKIP